MTSSNARIPITLRLESFEGPLDLLLYLIQSHELDISKVSLSKITDQYLIYVRLMQELDFDIASEFLVMAATLIHWKSKSLLPVDPSEQAQATDEDLPLSPEELLRQLLEHQRFLAAGQDLAQLPRLHEDVFTRSNAKPPIERVWRDMNVSDLTLSMQDTLVRAHKRKRVLKKETVSLSTKIAEFSDRLEIGALTSIKQLLSMSPSRPEIVVTFLASLELAKLKKLKVFQEGAYQEIFVKLIENIQGLAQAWSSEFDEKMAAVEQNASAPVESVPAELIVASTESAPQHLEITS